MSEQLLQNGLSKSTPTAKIGKWDFYHLGATNVSALKAAHLIRDIDYGDVENKKVDALLVNRKDVIAIVEYKIPKEFKTAAQKKKAINQEIEVARKLDCKIIVATDTIDTVWVNALTGGNITDENGVEVSYPFDVADEKLPGLIEKINYSINEKNNQILPKKLVNPTDLARSIWQDVWSVSGATPENCLYTFVELFIFKYLSDLEILRSTNSFHFLMSMYKDGNSVNEVLEYYATNVRKKIKELFPYNPIDNTTIINGTIFVSKDQKAVAGYSTVFKKVLQKFSDYGRLDHIDYDFKSKLFESFLKESISKKNWGQFFTPMKVIRAIEKIAKDEIKEGAVICDPACGVGKFLLEPIKSRLDQFYIVKGNTVTPKITIRGFDKGFDKDEQKTIILAKANMLIYFSEIIKDYPNHTKEFAKIFNDSFSLKTNSILGTLRDPVENEYDLILTNPPYVTSGSSNLKDEIQKDLELRNHYKINAIGVEGLFMEWIIRALKPGGKAYVVVPDGVFNRQNDKNLRAFLRQECIIDGIISLPLNTFFTTNKKTYILCLTKKHDRAEVQVDPVFTYLVSEIGETRDVYRFEIEQNDLDEAATLFRFFKGNKDSFSAFNKDVRCKVFPIDTFSPEANWNVERWWSPDEKIALKIQEEEKTVSHEDLPYLIEDVAENILSYKTMLLEISQKKKFEPTFANVTVGDVFTFPAIKGVSKSFVEKHKGGIPVYGSAQLEEPIGHIEDNLPGLKYFENCLGWNRNGSTGYVFWHKDRFTTTDDHRPMQLKPEFVGKVDLEYAQQAIQKVLLQQFSWSDKAGKDKVAKVQFPVPVTLGGNFDIDAQLHLTEINNAVGDLKGKVQGYTRAIAELNVVLNPEFVQSKEVTVDSLFEIRKGSAKFTRHYGDVHKGTYPVYSASNVAPLTHIDSYEYDGRYLTWATNGFAGYVMILDGKFSCNGDRGILVPRLETVDLDYVKIMLEPVLRALAKGRKDDDGGNEFTKVYPSMVSSVSIVMPIRGDGEFDLQAQQDFAEQYANIDSVRNSMISELKRLERAIT